MAAILEPRNLCCTPKTSTGTFEGSLEGLLSNARPKSRLYLMKEAAEKVNIRYLPYQPLSAIHTKANSKPVSVLNTVLSFLQSGASIFIYHDNQTAQR